MTTFDAVSKKLMLVNALRLMTRKKIAIWAAVADICGTGSTTSAAICVELGMDPNGTIKSEIKKIQWP